MHESVKIIKKKARFTIGLEIQNVSAMVNKIFKNVSDKNKKSQDV